MIEFRNVTKVYNDHTVLDDLSFEIDEGLFVVLVGPSGCGKTTTLKTINRLIEPTSGKILINGEDTEFVDREALRRSIGYVIQQIGLFPNMTVAQNISIVPRLLKYDKARCDKIVHEMLEMVNMPYEQYANKYPTEMSGGQQQRIGVLRALAASPPIVLMDEPFGALDPMTRGILQVEVRRIQKQLKKTIVFVTHDMDEALGLADVIIFMENGRISQMASPEEILRAPATDMICRFLGRHIEEKRSNELTAADFVDRDIDVITKDTGCYAATELMKRRKLANLIVVDEAGKYSGVLYADDLWLDRSETVEPYITYGDRQLVHLDDPARQVYDDLIDSGDNFQVVLNDDDTVAGVITRGNIARAIAARVWR